MSLPQYVETLAQREGFPLGQSEAVSSGSYRPCSSQSRTAFVWRFHFRCWEREVLEIENACFCCKDEDKDKGKGHSGSWHLPSESFRRRCRRRC